MSKILHTSIQRFLCLSVLLMPIQGFANDEPTSNYFTTSDDVKIHYLTLGDEGSYVMLVHGFSGSADQWVRLGTLQALSNHHKVIAIDLRDHGKSEKTVDKLGAGENYRSSIQRNRFNQDAYNVWFDSVLEVEGLLDHLKIEKAHVHGYSSGADVVKKLLFADQSRFVTASIGGAGINEFEKERIDAIPEEKQHPGGMFTAFIGLGPDVDLSFIHVPVLAINGEFDNPITKTTRMQREIDNFKSIVISGRGHMDAPLDPEYLQELSSFIDSNDP